MLPFLKKRDEQHNASVIVKTREPDKSDENQDDTSSGIEACAKDLIAAVNAGNVKDTAEALKSAFEILDSQPHEEGPHTNPHSYEAQKEE